MCNVKTKIRLYGILLMAVWLASGALWYFWCADYSILIRVCIILPASVLVFAAVPAIFVLPNTLLVSKRILYVIYFLFALQIGMVIINAFSYTFALLGTLVTSFIDFVMQFLATLVLFPIHFLPFLPFSIFGCYMLSKFVNNESVKGFFSENE